jgi:hypothetical protein
VRSLFALTMILLMALVQTRSGYAQESQISIGQTVEVVTNDGRLNLRRKPGIRQEIVAKLENGTLMRVVGGPQTADNFTWWELEGELGSGWAAEPFLRLAETKPNLPSNAQTTTTEQFIADLYGFQGWCFLGWRKPTPTDISPVSVDTVETIDEVKYAGDKLATTDYNVRIHNNNTAVEAFNRISESKVFFFYGHGSNNGLLFHTDQCERILTIVPG